MARLGASYFETCCAACHGAPGRNRNPLVTMPLAHPPGHAQADFGEAVIVIGGVEQKAHFFVMDLPHSDACLSRGDSRGLD